jgi:molybdopterin molybdotransferase
MISADEARNIILQNTAEIASERISLLDAYGRVLAEDVRSNDDIPPFDNSSMDGFAVFATDTVDATTEIPVRLTIQREIAAGDRSGPALQQRNAIRILTGAPLPEGADAVIPLENVVERDGSIIVREPVAAGQSTRKRGEDVRKEEAVALRGTRMSAAYCGVLASIGRTHVQVFKKPTMAILTTGNELVPVDEHLSDGKIRNSNVYSLQALARENNCVPVDLGVSKDERQELLDKVRNGLNHDLLVTSGGVSAGKYDYVLDAMKAAGVDLKFWKVNIKPGMPMAFGIYARGQRKIPVFCLPGNPVSTVVTFLQFVRPSLYRMTSVSSDQRIRRLFATLEHDIKKSDGKRHYHRGIIQSNGGKLSVRSTGNQSSGVLSSLTKADCLIILGEEKSTFCAGDEVEIEMLP